LQPEQRRNDATAIRASIDVIAQEYKMCGAISSEMLVISRDGVIVRASQGQIGGSSQDTAPLTSNRNLQA